MEEALQNQSLELQRCRREYMELTGQLTQIQQTLRERDLLHREKVETLQSQLKRVEREVDDLQYMLSKQKNRSRMQNEKYERARVELENVANMLDLREQEVEQKLLDSEAKCRQLKSTVHQLEEEAVSSMEKMGTLVSYNEKLNAIIENEMVPIDEVSAWKMKYEKLQDSVSTDMVCREDYERVVRQLEARRVTMDQETVPRDEYELLQDKYLRLQKRTEGMVSVEQLQELEGKCTEMVACLKRDTIPLEKYRALKKRSQQLFDDQKLLQESSQVHQQNSETARSDYAAAEARAMSLQERVESSEAEIRELLGRLHTLEQHNRQLEEELSDAQALASGRGESADRLQEEKAALLVQLGYAKSQLAKETQARSELMDAVRKNDALVAQLQRENSDAASQHAKMLLVMGKKHDAECAKLHAYCMEWKSFVDRLQTELVGPTGEATAGEAFTNPAEHSTHSASHNFSGTCQSRCQESNRTGRSSALRSDTLALRSSPPTTGEGSRAPSPETTLSPLLRRLEQQERELIKFRQSMHPQRGNVDGSQPWTSSQVSQLSSTGEAVAEQGLMRMSARELCPPSPSTVRSLLDSPGKEILLRSLQKDFDSTVQSSCQFVNEKLISGHEGAAR